MAANPSGAHQAGRAFAGRIDGGGVSVYGVGVRWHACDRQSPFEARLRRHRLRLPRKITEKPRLSGDNLFILLNNQAIG
jgi:hypothetical protein